MVLGFGGWDVAAVLVQATVVEPVDPLGGGVLDSVGGAPGPSGSDELGLVQPVDGLSEGVEAPMSSGCGQGVFGARRVADDREGLAGDVALEDELAQAGREPTTTPKYQGPRNAGGYHSRGDRAQPRDRGGARGWPNDP